MTREEKIICKEFLNDADTTHSCNEYKLLMALLEQEPTTKIEESNFSQEQYLADIQGAYDCGKSVLDKIFCIVHPLSIMSTPELEHKAIMQIAEMLEPLCLPESEDT